MFSSVKRAVCGWFLWTRQMSSFDKGQHFLSPERSSPATKGAEELALVYMLSTYCVLWALAVISFNPTATHMVDTAIIFIFANEETEAQSC